jgi:hypothetical protein
MEEANNFKHGKSLVNMVKTSQERRYQIYCARRVSGITFIRYAQSQNNLKVFGSKKTKEPTQNSQNRLR